MVLVKWYVVQKAKIRYVWVFFYRNCQNKVLRWFYSIENAKIRYGWSFNILKILK